MSADPNRLLFVMSAHGSMTWGQFREAVDYFAKSDIYQEKQIDGTASRSGLLQCLEALGHCDAHYENGESTISVTPPALCRLPKAGLPETVLTGARCLRTHKEMADIAEGCGGMVRLTVESHPGPMGLLPDTIRVSATSEEAMAEYCALLGIRYVAIPPAWSLMHWSGMLSDYEANASFDIPEGLNWTRFDFDVTSLDFGRNRTDAHPRYSRYRNPTTNLPLHVFFRDGRGAAVDLNWGRYLLLNARGITVTAYDQRRFRLYVPVRAPIPGVVARTVCLCSGKPPIYRSIERLVRGIDCQDWLMFEDVPPPIALSALSKVGQTPAQVEIL